MADTSYPSASPLALATSDGLSEGFAASQGSSLNTGDLRRRYDFSERFGELAIDQTPFFRLVSSLAKKPTDDPQFKFTEKRHSFHKRYAYVVGFYNGSADKFDDATLKESDNTALSAGGEVKVYMATDYFSAGNIQNIQGQANGAIKVGDAGTAPEWIMKNQIIKIPMSSTSGGGAVTDYALIRVTAVGAQAAKDLSGGGGIAQAEVKLVTGKILRLPSVVELASFSSNAPDCVVHDEDIAESLEAKRSYVVGNSYGEGSSLTGESYKDNPYSTGFGQTQIFRTEFGMTNTARATALKYEPNEWARTWREKLIEHKWEIEHAGLFSTQASVDSVAHTQGAIDYVLNYGNIFDLTLATKTIDDFLQDMSRYQDPRYNQDQATVYMCSTAVYTWFHKIGGFFKNNIGIGQTNAGASNAGNQALFGADLAITGRKKVMGLDVTEVSTVYGSMNLARCVALDSTDVKILALNMNNVAYRPLVGNGVNRDTAVYVGVQNLENTGVDKRVDIILTEAGFEFMMPESHAIWK